MGGLVCSKDTSTENILKSVRQNSMLLIKLHISPLYHWQELNQTWLYGYHGGCLIRKNMKTIHRHLGLRSGFYGGSLFLYCFFCLSSFYIVCPMLLVYLNCPLTDSTTPHLFLTVSSQDLDFHRHISRCLFLCQCVKVIDDCSFCWYWWN